MRCKRFLLLISLLYPNVIEPLPEIYFGKHFLTPHVINQLSDQWEQIVILYHLVVQVTVVHYHPLATIFLAYEKYQRRLR